MDVFRATARATLGKPFLGKLNRLGKLYRGTGRYLCQDVTLSTPDSNLRSDYDADPSIAQVIAEQLIARIGLKRFDLWLGDRDCIAYESGDPGRAAGVVVYSDNLFSLNRIQNTFGSDLRSIVDRVCGPQVGLEYRVRSEDESSCDPAVEVVAGRAADTERPAASNASDHAVHSSARSSSSKEGVLPFALEGGESDSPAPVSPPSSRRILTLGNFWFGEENRLANVSVDQLIEQPGQFSPFFVYGPAGCGKTHLVEGIVHAYRRQLKLRRSVFLSAEQFTTLFIGALRGGAGLPMFRRKYRDLDLLVIDDVQFFAGKRATLNEFQHTIDNLVRLGKQVVVTSDRPPIELGALGNDLAARLTAGLTCPLRYPGFDGRLKIIQQLCAQRQLKLPRNVLELICERLTRDVRRLSGAINRLHAVSISNRCPITLDMAQTELCEMFSVGSGGTTTIHNIEQAVCEFCGVQPSDIKSSSRKKSISTARMLAMYLAREHTSSALSEIGDYFGGRSHSTVIAAKKKVNRWIDNNDGVSLPNATYPAKEVIRRIESNLRIG